MLALLAASWNQRWQPLVLTKSADALIQVEIKGEVREPGIYELSAGCSVAQLLDKAGGPLEQADLSALNLNRKLRSADVVVVGALNESGQSELISINTAGPDELMKLERIGPAMAQRIIDYRTQTPFASLEQIMEVRGIGPKTYEKIREKICL